MSASTSCGGGSVGGNENSEPPHGEPPPSLSLADLPQGVMCELAARLRPRDYNALKRTCRAVLALCTRWADVVHREANLSPHPDYQCATLYNGKLHRDEQFGPAVRYAARGEGEGEWFHLGERHRGGDKPALVLVSPPSASPMLQWWARGRRHRGGGRPAEITDKHLQWYVDGELHRDGGPAVISRDDCGPVRPWSHPDNVHLWFRKGLAHREGGPAVECGLLLLWYRDGRLHREGGPAVLSSRDTVRVGWFLDGQPARPDGRGPALVMCDRVTEMSPDELIVSFYTGNKVRHWYGVVVTSTHLGQT